MARSFARLSLAAITAAAPVAALCAQDFSMVGSSVAGITMPQVLNPCSGGCGGGARSGGGSALAMRAIRVPPRPAAATMSLGYVATPALRQQVLNDYLTRARSKDPQGTQAVQQMFARYDYTRIYEGVARPYGLGGDDAANAMSAYFILGWIIANGQSDVPGGAAAVRAVRAQFAATLSQSPAGSPRNRAQLGEELKVQFAIMHAGWQGSMKEHSQRAYADGIARQFQQQAGIDLRSTSLDARGFVRHG